jgi:dimethylargininase
MMFTKAIVRPPGVNFSAGLTTVALGPPDHARALEQHKSYCEALERCGLELVRLEADEAYPDSTFVEDTAVIVACSSGVSAKVVLTRPGAASRAGEVKPIKEALAHFGFETVEVEPPGTLDGGDVCEAENHFFIGISQRTNESGARQLADLLSGWGKTSSFVEIRGLEGLLHLKSGLAHLGDRRLVVIDALQSNEAFRDYEIIRVRPDEKYAANCVRVNRFVLAAAGYPHFQQTLAELGYETILLEMSEFQKMDGGLSCLSLRF